MTILDRYLVSKYMKTFFFTVLLFSIIAVVIDFSEKLEKFIDNKVPAREVLGDYYLNYVPDINAILWPLFALIAVVFFCSRLAKNVEFVAMFSSGLGINRLLKPLLWSSAIIMTILLIANHLLLPITNKTKLAFENKYITPQRSTPRNTSIHTFIGPDIKIFIRYYNHTDSSASDAYIERYEQGRIVEYTKIGRLKYLGKDDLWKIHDIEKYALDSANNFVVFGKKETGGQDTTLYLRPDDFLEWKYDEKRLTTPQILTHLERQKERGSQNVKPFKVELYRRTAEPMSILILSLIGMAVGSKKTRGGMGVHLAVGISLGALFVFLSKLSISFANNPDLNPFIGVWIPNIVFGGVAWWLIKKAQQ